MAPRAVHAEVPVVGVPGVDAGRLRVLAVGGRAAGDWGLGPPHPAVMVSSAAMARRLAGAINPRGALLTAQTVLARPPGPVRGQRGTAAPDPVTRLSGSARGSRLRVALAVNNAYVLTTGAASATDGAPPRFPALDPAATLPAVAGLSA
ncbi:MAG: hypothetical protein ACRDL8_22260 [Solirubrobacteraceae bacterium]